MITSKTIGCLCLLWLAPVTTAIAASEADVLASLSLPANTHLQSVSLQGQYNGKVMAVAALQSTDDSVSVAAFFKHLWRGGNDSSTPGFIENSIPGWTLISHLQGDFHIVVQLHQAQSFSERGGLNASQSHSQNRSEHRSKIGNLGVDDTSGARGFISVTRVSHTGVLANVGPFSNLQRLSTNHTKDGADSSQLSVYASPASLQRTHELYLPKLQQGGWQVLADTRVDQGWVTVLSRNQSRLELSFLDSSEFASVVVAHELLSK